MTQIAKLASNGLGGERLEFEDLKSRNGTLLNGQLITDRTHLHDAH